jgi:rubrerythrin
VTAIEDLERDPASRKRFLKMMGGGGAAGALALFAAACGSSSSSSGSGSTTSMPKTTAQKSGGSAKGDLAILNYALTLEYLETAFYEKVGAAGLFKGKVLDTLKTFGSQESQHVDALKATITKLGGTPVTAPKTKFTLGSASEVAKLAATVENLGANAYLGQAGNIKSKEVLAAALSIHSVEARHAAVLNTLTNQSPTPQGAFAKPASMSTVLAAVKPFIVS